MRHPGHDCDSAKASWIRPLWLGLIGMVAVACTLFTAHGPARAASEVQGKPADMRLLVDNASTQEILQALSISFGLTYSLPQNIGRNLTGTYSGSLRQVLARILDGTDYILTVSDGPFEVVVLGAAGVSKVASSDQPIVRTNSVVVPTALSSKAPPPLGSYLTGNGSARTP